MSIYWIDYFVGIDYNRSIKSCTSDDALELYSAIYNIIVIGKIQFLQVMRNRTQVVSRFVIDRKA